jgi:membrane protein required for colicin V production
MNWLDIVLALILAVSVASSYRKGLSREVIGLVSVILALLLGIWFYGTAAAYLSLYISSSAAASFAGFCVVFCLVMLLGALVSFIVGKFLRVTGLSIIDHALGAGFGLARGIIMAIALIMGMMAFSRGGSAPPAVVESRLAPYVVDAARFVASLAPRELKEGFRKSYAQVKEAWSNAIDNGIRSEPIGKKEKNERQI